MGDRYGVYPRARPRSPTFYPARASLPIDIGGGYSSPVRVDHHMRSIPSRREIIPPPRSSSSSLTTGPVITTTYKVSAEPSRAREGSRTRRSTLDSNSRPPIPITVTTAPRHKPVVHSARPASPLKDPYRSSQEDYYAVPATSRHQQHHHHKRHSTTIDNADMARLARERESSRLRVGGPREPAYTAQRTQPRYGGTTPHRHPDTVADDYGDNGYGYTNPRDLVQYDLNASEAPRYHRRRESFGQDGRKARPSSITGYSDLAPTRSFDGRERGPPPTTRGFDKIPSRPPITEWDPSRMDPIQRPASVNGSWPGEPIQRPPSVTRSRGPEAAFEPEPRRSGSRRPVSLYHDREPRRSQREEYYEAREEDPRRRSEKPLRHERNEDERRPSDRPDSHRPEKRDDDKKDHRTRDVLTTGLSLAGAALGAKAFTDAIGGEKEEKKEDKKDEREDRDDRDDRRRREYDEEPRRRRDPRDERGIDIHEPKLERRLSRDRDRERGPPEDFIDLSDRNPQERLPPRNERDRDPDPRLRRDRPDTSLATSDVGVGSGSSIASDEVTPRRRRQSGAPAFNPKDTMDLLALKEALNNKEGAEAAPARTPSRTPRGSISRVSQELAKVRSDLDSDGRELRIVTPPLPADQKAPVKGILRAPKEKFPEDPAPIREGVAPLKDAKKDGVPPDARWTKIPRKLVNPEALEAGKERYEAREDFVIVLRVLSRDEVQGYAEVTERIRAAREELEEEEERSARRRARRERHERHKRERISGTRGSSKSRRKEKESESDTTEDDDKPKLLEGAPMMSGGLGISGPGSAVSAHSVRA